MNNQFSDETLAATMLLVLASLSAFHLEALLGGYSEKRKCAETRIRISTDAVHIRKLGYVLVMISVIPTALVIVENARTVWSAGYGELYANQAPTGFGAIFKILSAFIIPGALFLLAGSKNNKIGRAIAIIIVASYSIFMLFLGYRGWTIMPILAFLWLWHKLIKPIKAKILIASSIVAMVIVFPLSWPTG